MKLAVARWYCSSCGIVRDTIEGDGEVVPPFCRCNVPELRAQRMRQIDAWHPCATGPLPWGSTDPSRSC